MNREQIRSQLVKRIKEILNELDGADALPPDQVALAVLETFTQCLAGSVVGSITFPEGNRPSAERIEQLKWHCYWRLLEQAHKLLAQLSIAESQNN